MDGNGTVIGGLTDEKTNVLHFEHGAGAVGEGFVEVVGAGEGVDGDGRGGGHFFLFLSLEEEWERWEEGGCLLVGVLDCM